MWEKKNGTCTSVRSIEGVRFIWDPLIQSLHGNYEFSLSLGYRIVNRFNLLYSAFTLTILTLARDVTNFVFHDKDKAIRNKRNLLKRHKPNILNLLQNILVTSS